MKTVELKLLIVCVVVSCFMAAGTALGEPTFMVDSYMQWESLLYPEGPNESRIGPVMPHEWYEYVEHWNLYLEEGNAIPYDTVYCYPELYVYEGNDPCYPQNNPCLVMAWGQGDQNAPDVNYAGAWKFVYGEDPDLRDCTITLRVYPPGMDFVSFGLSDTSNRIVSWRWDIPAALPGPGFTTITINTNNIGLGTAAAVPNASSFAANPNFDLSNVASFIVNETYHDNFPGVFPAPPPGGAGTFIGWNAWDSYSVTKNTGGGPGPGGAAAARSKWYVKWSQPPVAIDPNAEPPTFIGWDELSDYNNPPNPIVADDWKCEDDRPITDIHWWGSFLGWDQPHVPPVLPKAFHIGIWTDDPCDFSGDFSHPDTLVWENYCDNWVWNFAGFDESPRGPSMNDSCFQFTQLLSQDEWFYQEPNDPCHPNGARVYWLSIAAIYDPNDYTDPNFRPWGWKTREHFFNDDAVRITNTFNPVDGTMWPPTPPKVGSTWVMGDPIFWPDLSTSWDVAFELTTNRPTYKDNPIPGDLNGDKIVNFYDLAILANNWLKSAP